MATTLTSAFLALVFVNLGLKYWLARRHIRHVAANAGKVPPQFADSVSLEAHHRAAAYTIAKQRMAMLQASVGAALLLAATLLGGLQLITDVLGGLLGHGFAFQFAVVGAVVAIVSVVDLPFEWYRQFRVEQAFGFNRMTPALFFADTLKSLALGIALGGPLLAVVLALMAHAGSWWWVYAWLVWAAFTLALSVLFPVLIAPLFNRFTPLADGALRQRIQDLLARTGFTSSGVFTMDGSRRSSHGNAYFTGLGAAKRIVFYDTLIDRLQPAEIEAVLAHELGHFRLHHVTKRLLLTLGSSLVLLALLGWVARQAWFYRGLGVEPLLDAGNDGLALVLFLMVVPVFTFLLAPLGSLLSRRHEFEADAFAAGLCSPSALVAALVKLYQDNATTLTPDPIHSTFYDSHPPASIRIDRLLARARPAGAV
ncbi:MAG TPA: M48 family metallopeptidase [Burkholderiaceae bacterium]